MDFILNFLSVFSNWFNVELDLSNIDTSQIMNLVSEVQNTLSSISSNEGEIASAPVILLAGGFIIFLGVLGESFFKRTGVPDIAFLMILGVIIGPVLGLIKPNVISSIVPYFSAIALIIIMYDGGLHLDFKNIAKIFHYAFILAFVGFGLSVAIVSIGAHEFLNWEWSESILLGAIVGGSSSIIVFGLVRNIKVSEETKSLLSFESALTDILATVIAFIMFEAIIAGHFDLQVFENTLGRAVAVGLILGLGVGIPWMYITTKLANGQHAYMLTLGILFVLFFLSNYFGESGALTALVFGLMLGNKANLAKALRFKMPRIDSDDPTHNQLTFLVRTFFFVFVGLMAAFGNVEYIIFGIGITICIFFGRAIISKITLTKRFHVLDKTVTTVMIPRGLAAAVLATFPLTLGLPNAEAYPQIVFFIIMASMVITTIGLGKAKKIPPPESNEGGFIKETPKEA